MFFRRAVLEDIDFIMETEYQSFSKNIVEKKETFLQRISACPETFLIFISENEECMGYISAEFIETVPCCMKQIAFNHLPEKNTKGKILYISSFAINKKFRGSHNGKTAFFMALEYFEKSLSVEKTVLLVNEIWFFARKIYEKAGFIEISRFDKAFPSDSDENFQLEKSEWNCGILMEKENGSLKI